VTLASSSTVASVPASVTIPAKATIATFKVTTKVVTKSTPVEISGTYKGVKAAATLTVKPAALATITVSPSTVTGGSSSTGTVTLTGPAAIGGVKVTLSSSNTGVATLPASATVAAGASTAKFTVRTKAVKTTTTVTISGTYSSVKKTASLTVKP